MAIRRALVALFAVSLLASFLAGPVASAQTQQKVDDAKEQLSEAQAALEAALAEREFVETEMDAAIERYQAVTADLADLTYRTSLLRDRVAEAESEMRSLRDDARSRAIQAYMAGGADSLDVFFEAETFNQLVTSQHVLEQATARSISDVDRLAAVKRELEKLREQLDEEAGDESILRGDTEDAAAALQELVARAEEIVDQAESLRADSRAQYRDAVRKLEAEKLRRRIAELAKLHGAAAGVPAEVTPGFICPVSGPHWFINDWGFPRSGGRTHKGTDMFASRGTPLVAVADGTVSIANRGLGGKIVWLTADYGVAFYYAHLDGWPSGLKSGDRVSKGQVVGFVGDSGNARGGSPHNHFQLHPGGRGSPPVNPYPTLVRACR